MNERAEWLKEPNMTQEERHPSRNLLESETKYVRARERERERPKRKRERRKERAQRKKERAQRERKRVQARVHINRNQRTAMTVLQTCASVDVNR